MTEFNVEVKMLVNVKIDETKFTEQFLFEYRESFYKFYDVEDHAKHVAQLAARELHRFGHNRTEFVEGYGQIGDLGIWAEVKETETEVVTG